MTNTSGPEELSWVPAATCTLPSVDQPVRVEAFDQLFRSVVLSVGRAGPTRARLELRPEPEVAAQAAELSMRETSCCSFFGFTLTAGGGRLDLDITVPETHQAILEALLARVALVAPAAP